MELMQPDLNTQPTPLFLRRQTRFVCGVDLGQASDPSAICILEHLTGVIDEGSDFERHTGLRTPQREVEYLDCRHLERLPLGLSYPAQVQRVADLLSRPPLNDDGKTQLVIDETGVGRAVGDIFNTAGLSPIKISITAGSEVTCVGDDRFRVSKTALVSTVDALLNTGKLRFAAGLSEAGAMRDELQDFRRHVSDAGRATYQARVGRHDDLVLSVAIAAWWISRPPAPQTICGTWGTFNPQTVHGYGGNYDR